MQVKENIEKPFNIPVTTEFFLYLFPILLTFGDWRYGSAYIFLLFLFQLKDKVLLDHYNFRFPYPLIWIFILIWGVYILSKSSNLNTAFLYYIGTILTPFLIFMIFDNIVLNKIFLEKLFKVFFISGIILGGYSIFAFLSSQYNSNLRLSGFWENYNIVSAYLMILFMFNLSFIVNREKGENRIFYYISLFVITTGIMFTQTRGVWLAILISLAIFIIKRPKIIIPAILIIGFFLIYFYDTISVRYLTVKNFSSDLSSIGRFQAWVATITLLKNNLFFGYGFDAFMDLRDSVISIFLVPVLHSHNTYLRSLLEIGLIGSIFYYYFFIKAAFFSFIISKKDKKNIYKRYSDGLQLSFIGLLIAFIFEPYFSLYGTSTIVIWILISISFSIRKEFL